MTLTGGQPPGLAPPRAPMPGLEAPQPASPGRPQAHRHAWLLPPGPAPNTPWPGGQLRRGSGNPNHSSFCPSFLPSTQCQGAGLQAPTGRPPEVWAEGDHRPLPGDASPATPHLSAAPSPRPRPGPGTGPAGRRVAAPWWRQAVRESTLDWGPGLICPAGPSRGRGGLGRGEGGWGVCPVMVKTAVGAPWPRGEC